MNPGLLRETITFYRTNTDINIYGGATANLTLAITTRAYKKPFTQNNQYSVDIAISALTSDSVFRIRQRNDFTPTKDMYIVHQEQQYEINAIMEYDNSGDVFHKNRYWEIIAVKRV